jgi:23S rRNA (guanosine2251-2'-O)-methyltransferase
MKPPHGSRPGGSSRPPSDRGPYRGPGGQAPRPPGQGMRGDARAGHGDGPNGGRDAQTSQQDGPRTYGSRPDTRPQGGKAHHGGKTQAKKPQDGTPRADFKQRAPQDDFQARTFRDGGPERLSISPQRQRGYETARYSSDTPKGTVWLYGHHAVAAALSNPARRLRRLLVTEEGEAAIVKLLPPPWAVAPERVDRGRLDYMLGRDIAHQGAALLADPLAPPSLQSVLEKSGVIVVLDQVTDPRNVGAILRSAAAFGASAVITQDRNAPEETGGLAKAASGALEKMPLLRAVNIARTIIALKAANVWCIGLDAGGKPLSGPAFGDRRVALVLGAEGEGLRRLTRETCDEIAGLTIRGGVESLNVSAAASVALYELSKR